MEVTIKKVFIITDFDKEENRLNEMAAKGFILKSRKGRKYTFKECLTGEYIIFTELLKHLPTNKKSAERLNALKNNEIELITSSGSLIYLKRKSEFGFPDLTSNRKYRMKYINLLMFTFVLIVFQSIIQCISGLDNYFSYGSLPRLYWGLLSLVILIISLFMLPMIIKGKRRLKKGNVLLR